MALRRESNTEKRALGLLLEITLLESGKFLSSGTIRVLMGVALAWTAAFLSAQAFAGTTFRTTLPLWFILVLFFLARRYGFAVGVIGSFVCAFVFAHFLFDPTGSWHVDDAIARRNLLWMVLGTVALSYLLAPHQSEPDS